MRIITIITSSTSYSYSHGYHSYHENSPTYDAIKQYDTHNKVSV
jgi:hypothetical protein